MRTGGAVFLRAGFDDKECNFSCDVKRCCSNDEPRSVIRHQTLIKTSS